MFVFSGNQLIKANAVAIATCVSTGPQCGTDNGTQTQTLTTDFIGICPSGYSYQNNGNYDQRCHRNENCDHDQCPSEHVSPTRTTCPTGYTMSGSGAQTICTEVVTQSCHTGTIDYSACTPTATPTPTTAPTATPTPTSIPSNGGGSNGGGDGRSDGLSSCPQCTQAPQSSEQTQVLGASTQAVLGASTMAGTGTFETSLMNLMLAFGMMVLGAGAVSYAKEKKI